MFVRFQRLRADEEGQSLVLACVALLVLTLGVMATVNLGRAVHQRIALQNTADASAYSMAALEARAFNYYAFANRTQVVHYVSAMVFQSYLSFFSFLQAVAAEMVAVLHTLDQCHKGGLCAKAGCKLLKAIPVIGEIIAAIDGIIQVVDQAATQVLSAINAVFDAFDVFVGKMAIPALRFMNWLLWASTKLVAFDIATDLPEGYPEVITKNDDQVKKGNPIIGAVNELSFRRAHNLAAGGDPLNPASEGKLPDNTYDSGDNDLTFAKRGMAEVTNGTRYNKFVTSRMLEDFFPPFMRTFIDTFEKLGLSPLDKMGQTKLTSIPIRSNGSKNYIRKTGMGSSVLAEGNVLGADDVYRILSIVPDFLIVWGDKHVHGTSVGDNAVLVSVWAQEKGGYHWRLVPNHNGADGQGIKKECFPTCLCGLTLFKANVELDPRDRNHDWEGLVPFQAFEPSTDFQGAQFNQPTDFVFLNKTYDQIRRNHAGDVDRLKDTSLKETTATAGVGGPAQIDSTDDVTMPGPLQSGQFNVVSRGMAYYHRPHNWEEPPNFFNPYWRPKLDPVIHGEGQVPFFKAVLKALPAQLQERALVH